MNRHRLVILALICAFWSGIMVVAHFFPSFPLLANIWRSEQSFEDLLRREGRKTATFSDTVFIGIDTASREDPFFDDEQKATDRAAQLMTSHPFPWSRELWALLLDRLFQAGARLVIFDLVFSPPNEGDAAFRAALDRYRDKVVVGADFDFSSVGTQGGVVKNVMPNASLIAPPQMEDDRVGYVVFFPDSFDNKIRYVRYTLTPYQLARMAPQPDEVPYESLAARVLEKQGLGALVPRDLKPHVFRFSALDAYPPHPLFEIFENHSWHANYQDGAFFKNKIVLVGPSAQIMHDFVSTPLSPETPGPDLHLHAIAATRANEFLKNAPLWVDFTGIAIAGLVAWLCIALTRRPLVCLATLVGTSLLYLVAVRLFYDYMGLILLVVPTLAAFILSGLFGLSFEYILERLEKLRMRRTLERYVSKNLVQEILDNPDSYYHSMLGSRKPVTVLFSDIIGFTSLSEKADPAALVKLLNEYLSGMVGVVFENGGTLDKFIGDAIMAVWGNVKSRGVDEDAKCAVRAALGMRAELRKLNERWKGEGRPQLGFGVGINHGEAIIGNIGSYEPHERLDPTVIGDSVNLASRLEALTRAYSVDVLIGPTAADLVKDEFHLRSVARVQVKGKSLPVDVFTLIGARNGSNDAELLKWLESYEEGIAKFRERDFTAAKILFSRFLEFYPEDFLAKMYLERALEYEQQPPDEAWNAVEVFQKK
ncbi:MAG TPA: adenylate/guanylate cyclase domain-containing protein [Chthoniobacterales bacterium]